MKPRSQNDTMEATRVPCFDSAAQVGRPCRFRLGESMNSLGRPTSSCLYRVLLFAFYLWFSVGNAQEMFLNSYWLNNVGTTNGRSTNVAASIWSGGNESSGATNDTPYSQNGIYLIESAIGQITAQYAAYPNADTNLATAATTARTLGNAYRETNVAFNAEIVPINAWHVIFPGGFNPTLGFGTPYATNVSDSTYIAADIAQAEYYLRARLRVNPGDADAAQQLVLLVEDQMFPLEWSGTMAICYSAYARAQFPVLMQNGINQETINVEEARGYYQSACNVFSQFLANPPDAVLAEGGNPLLSSAVTNQVGQIVEDYLRILSEYAQASLSDLQLKDLARFYDPSKTNSPPVSQPLLNDIDSTVSEIQLRLLLAGPFQNIPQYSPAPLVRLKALYIHCVDCINPRFLDASRSTMATSIPQASRRFCQHRPIREPLLPTLLNLASFYLMAAATAQSTATNDIYALLQRQYDWNEAQQTLQ